MKKDTVFIVEDDALQRKSILEALDLFSFSSILEAGYIDQAQRIFSQYKDEIWLIILNIDLPQNEQDARKIDELITKRELSYQKWCVLDSKNKVFPPTDPEWFQLRFEIDSCDTRVFELIDEEAGIHLIHKWAGQFGAQGELNKRIIFTTNYCDNYNSVICQQAEILAPMSSWIYKAEKEPLGEKGWLKALSRGVQRLQCLEND